MQKIKPLRYSAQIGEEITIEVTPISVGAFVAAALDGERLIDTETLARPAGFGTTPRYKFTITGPVDTMHFVEMEFSFPQADAAARYDTVVSGSNGGSDSFTVSRDDSVKDKGLRFKVVA